MLSPGELEYLMVNDALSNKNMFLIITFLRVSMERHMIQIAGR
jgi:hypothetical protein